jgi:FMN phosphatase YigB (HAD superfamily)
MSTPARRWTRALCWDLGDTLFREDTERKDANQITQWVEWVPGMQAVFADLLDRQVPMAIVSDQTLAGATTALHCLGLHTDRFASVVISDEIDSCKPAAAMFTTALAELGLEPAQALMIGNHYLRDVTGAHDVGMPALWFRWNTDYPHAADTGRADYLATDAAQLHDAVLGWLAGGSPGSGLAAGYRPAATAH